MWCGTIDCLCVYPNNNAMRHSSLAPLSITTTTMPSDLSDTTLLACEATHQAALQHVSQQLPPTPLLKSHWLSNELGAQVLLKVDALQESRAFKLRGAINFLESFRANHPQNLLPQVVVTASGGSHGIAVALAWYLLHKTTTTTTTTIIRSIA